MTDFRKLAFVGLMSLGLATVGSAGCSSSNGSPGTGGSTGTGGTGNRHRRHPHGRLDGHRWRLGGGAAGATLGCAMSDAPAGPEIALEW